jgi:hypothetical protein
VRYRLNIGAGASSAAEGGWKVKKIAQVLGLALLATACSGPDDDFESEAFASSIPKPTSATPGTLGGPCGVNWVKCPTAQSAKQKFEQLERKTVTSKCSATWPADPNSRVRKTVWTMQVARLVNDHTGKYDQLETMLAEFDYGKVFPRSGQNWLQIKRNGVVVAEWVSSQADVEVPRSPSDLNNSPYIDVYRGGAEAVLAWFTTKNVGSIMKKGEQCNDGTIVKSPGGEAGGQCDYFQGDCFFCNFTRYASIGMAAAITGGLGAALGGAEAGAAIGGAGSLVGTALGDVFGCQKRCAAAECTKMGCECFRRATSSSDSQRCGAETKECCEKAGAIVDRGGFCFGNF